MKLNWGQAIFIFLIVFVAFAAAFLIFALSQSNDLVTSDYYERGADYTRQMEINSHSAVYKDSIQLLNRKSDVVARFSRSLVQTADTVQIYFYRPSDKKSDYRSSGLFRSDSLVINKDHLAKGRYQVEIRWNHSLKSYLVEKDFFIE